MAKFDMVMPKMGESIAEGTILKWLKRAGEPIEKDEVMLEISTDKVDSEIPSPVSGVITTILAEEGKTVDVGAKIAEIETGAPAEAGNGKEQTQVPQPATKPEPAIAPPAPPVAAPAAISDNAGEIVARRGGRFYSPLVRSIAKTEGISPAELDALPGTGASGRVTKKDILSYLKTRTAPKPPAAAKPAVTPIAYDAGRVEIITMDNMRRRIAEHMVKSKQVSPHVYSVSECDMSRIVQHRERVKKAFEQREGTKLTYTPFFVDATIRAIKDFPMINSSLDGDKVIIKKNINIGIAVALENGLIVPVIKNADSLNLVGLARATNDLAYRARNKQLKPDEVQDGTFSLTNMGTFGSLFGIPIINQPQVAILGIGAIKKTPVVVGDGIAIRDIVYLSLSYDHRIIDGAYGGQFLQRVVQYLESFEPSERSSADA